MHRLTHGWTPTFAALVALSLLASGATTADDPPPADDRLLAAPLDPTCVLGDQACVKCHAAEVEVWRRTPHAQTFEQLHRRPEAQQIASKLGVRSIKYDGRCVACHYTQQAQQNVAAGTDSHGVTAIAGVSCESCHGAARDWLDAHHDYGGADVTRLTESAEHRQLRLDNSIALGMRNPHNLYLVAQSCYRCHTVQDEQLVNVGGHQAGSLDFELVAWSQGLVRHNFVRSDGKTNEASSPERLRVMFVAGLIADLESSLRAVAAATTKDTYAVTAAQRAARAAARLQSASAKLQHPRLQEVLEVYASVQLKLNNGPQLSEAAAKIARIGFQFAEQSDGTELAAIDPFIPPPSSWK